MSTDLMPAVTAEPAAVPSVADITGDLHLVARNPGEMQVAQQQLVAWFEAKIAIAAKDAADLAESLQVAADHGWKTTPLERQHRNAVKRVQFYEKCVAAVRAGFCIVPNFPVDIFAVRTNRKQPLKYETETEWQNRDARSEAPPLGQGEYQNADTIIHVRKVPSGEVDPKTNQEKQIKTYFAHSFDEFEFPISVARPEIMTATAAAMALKCFDEIGVLPGLKRPQGDPLVIGRIHRRGPKGPRWQSTPHVSFLIAWYVDTSEL